MVIDWGAMHGHLLGHISCFVVLEDILDNAGIIYDEVLLKNGVYVVVENAFYVDDEEANDMLELLKPIQKEVRTDEDGEFLFYQDGSGIAHKYFLTDVEAIVEPCCVVPNIGGKENEYFMVKQRPEWVDLFVDWLDAPHEVFQDDELQLQEEMADLAKRKAAAKEAKKEAVNTLKWQRKEEEKEAK